MSCEGSNTRNAIWCRECKYAPLKCIARKVSCKECDNNTLMVKDGKARQVCGCSLCVDFNRFKEDV